MLEDRRVSPHGQLESVLCKCCFQGHHHQLMQEQDLSIVIHGEDIEYC